VAGFLIGPGNILTIAGNGVVGYQGDGGPATMAELNNPTGLVLSSAGNLYFSDLGNNVVREVIPMRALRLRLLTMKLAEILDGR
jgi:hypothetical protein